MASVKQAIETNSSNILTKQALWTEVQSEKFSRLNRVVKSMKEDIQTIKVSIKGQTQEMHETSDKVQRNIGTIDDKTDKM